MPVRRSGAGAGQQRLSGFQILELDVTVERKRQFRGRQHVEQRNFVTDVGRPSELGFDLLPFVVQVRNDNQQATSAEKIDRAVKPVRRRGAAGRVHLRQRHQRRAKMRLPSPARQCTGAAGRHTRRVRRRHPARRSDASAARRSASRTPASRRRTRRRSPSTRSHRGRPAPPGSSSRGTASCRRDRCARTASSRRTSGRRRADSGGTG